MRTGDALQMRSYIDIMSSSRDISAGRDVLCEKIRLAVRKAHNCCFILLDNTERMQMERCRMTQGTE